MRDPIAIFSEWLDLAHRHGGIAEPTAMCLATADAAGRPSARIVLLKSHDHRGFVFYTNLESRKSLEIRVNPHGALCFHWMPLERQVRIEGPLAPVSEAEADAYFASRPRDSRLGAWSSRQSRPLKERQELLDAVARNTARFEGADVPRPEYWSGWRLSPERMEFWRQSDFRLHDRDVFTRTQSGWESGKLYP